MCPLIDDDENDYESKREDNNRYESFLSHRQKIILKCAKKDSTSAINDVEENENQVINLHACYRYIIDYYNGKEYMHGRK